MTLKCQKQKKKRTEMKKKRNKNLKRKKWEGKNPKFLTTQNLRKKKKMKYMVNKRRRIVFKEK